MTVLVRKKIAMLGAFGVGKTSLVRKFVSNEFAETYVSTLGVRIEKHSLQLTEANIELLIWDVAGDDEFARLRVSYLRGASGLLYVADGTRTWTVDKLVELRTKAEETLKDVPWKALINKSDLPVDPTLDAALQSHGLENAVRTSAKTGNNVAEAFAALTQEMLG